MERDPGPDVVIEVIAIREDEHGAPYVDLKSLEGRTWRLYVGYLLRLYLPRDE